MYKAVFSVDTYAIVNIRFSARILYGYIVSVVLVNGILLSSAQEPTVSEVSDSIRQSNGTSPSAPESRSSSVEATSSASSAEAGSTSNSAIAAERSSSTVITTTETYIKISSSPVKVIDDNSTRIPSQLVNGGTSEDTQDGAFSTGKSPSNKSNTSGDSVEGNTSRTDDRTPENTVDVSETATSAVVKNQEYGGTTDAAENVSNYSRQNTVPSASIYNSSSVDKSKSSETVFTTTPSKVQTERSATRKRSLNATGSTTVRNSEERSSSAPIALPLSNSVPPDGTKYINHSPEISPTPEIPVTDYVTSNPDYAVIEDTVSTARYVMETDMTSLPHSAIPDTDISSAPLLASIDVVPELVSSGDLQDAHILPISSAALSTLSDESIQPSESIVSTAQTSNARLDISTTSQRFPELEIESADATHQPRFSTLSLTFDPNGMTHNFSQDPDSITFSPANYHGMSTDGHLARLENVESVEIKSEFVPDLSTVYVTEYPGSGAGEMGRTYSSEREREPASSASHGLLPHDEPDSKEVVSVRISPNTQQPAINAFSTTGPITVGTRKLTPPVNDESEEMLNDSPHFVQVQSKPTVTPTTKSKIVSKDLDINVSNDIAHATGSSSQNTPDTLNELVFSIHYQTEQSEIRPITAVSPLNMSESITVLPDSLKVESHSPSDVTESKLPDAILPDTSSPIILPNPAPNVVNQSAEVTTLVSPAESLPQSSASDLGLERDSTTSATNSTIAGVAVKTSVSVSLPLSNTPNATLNSTVDPAKDDANASMNVSGIVMPLPISKDGDTHPAPAISSTQAPSPSTTASRGIKIRKPKLRIGDDDDENQSSTARTRKPFLTPPQRASTTAGPPVSIFNKARTRGPITSSTTRRPYRGGQYSTLRVEYASNFPGMVPGGEFVFSIEPMTTTVPTTTETEEPFSDEPFTEQTHGPIVPSEDAVTLIKVAGCIVVDKGLRWNEQLNNRHTSQYKERASFIQIQLDRLFRTSPIASQLWKIQIDGFSGIRNSRAVVIDFLLYLIKTPNEISTDQLTSVFHDKLKNNTFSRFTVDTNKTTFEFLNEEPMRTTTHAPEEEIEPVIPQWAIAVIVVGAASLIFIVLFATVAILGRHHVRRRYSNKLNDEDSDRPSDWESKMAAAYENLAADTIYDVEDLHTDTYKKRYPDTTYHGRPTRPSRADSWSNSDWSPPPRRPRPQVHRIVY